MSRKELQHLGSTRESLSKNPLLIQSQVGKVRRRCMTLPSKDFTYGVQTYNKDGGVSEAVKYWRTHKRTWEYVAPPGKDFMALNKASVLGGLTTAQEQQHYRATHDIKVKRKVAKFKEVFKPPEGMTFGKPTRPSTPLYHILENKFGEDWLSETRMAQKVAREEEEARKLRGKVYETRATLLRRYSEPVEPPPYWKMKRWRVIPPTLGSFRTEKERSDAFDYHSSDAISRTGVHGHGIYQAAKS